MANTDQVFIPFQPLKEAPNSSDFKADDVLVIFGEVFARGYVNGLIEEAKANGMKVIYSTVGRRGENLQLRPLNQEELEEKKKQGQWPLINVPLECGFDLEPDSKGVTPVSQLKGLKLSEWQNAKMDWVSIEESKTRAIAGFRERVTKYMAELEGLVPKGSNIMFAHTMAGGVPRAKIVLPAMNRVFKGYGERFASSQEFWEGELGRFCSMSFMEVTAHSLKHLIELSQSLTDKLAKNGARVCYVAYGYHGNEILIKGEYQWQSYSPYLQGFAKLELEQHAYRASKKGIAATVFNVPEILTDSSAIFPGVEIPLYPLIAALRKENPGASITKSLIVLCRELLKPEHSIDEILQITDEYFRSNLKKEWTKYDIWPQHNGSKQMEQMQTTSERIIGMHKDPKQLLSKDLSEVVFRSCGKAIFREGSRPRKSVLWIGHDLVAKLGSQNE